MDEEYSIADELDELEQDDYIPVDEEDIPIIETEPEKPTKQYKGLSIVSFDGIMRKDVKPMNWIIPDLIPEGLTLFAGKQKMGKSFLAFQVSLSTAIGGYVLGRFKVDKAGALYLALEDGERRIYERGKVMAHDGYPELLDIAFSIDDIRKGGLDALQAYLDDHPYVRLVTFDIIGRAMALNYKADQRDEIYNALSPLQRVALDRS